MIRLSAVAALGFALAATVSEPASAQGQDCFAANLLTPGRISYGTQRVPRDPRGQRDLLTISVELMNISGRQLSFGGTFSAPPVAESFMAGQTWTLAPGQTTTAILGNVFKPGISDAVLRSILKLNCYVT